MSRGPDGPGPDASAAAASQSPARGQDRVTVLLPLLGVTDHGIPAEVSAASLAAAAQRLAAVTRDSRLQLCVVADPEVGAMPPFAAVAAAPLALVSCS